MRQEGLEGTGGGGQVSAREQGPDTGGLGDSGATRRVLAPMLRPQLSLKGLRRGPDKRALCRDHSDQCGELGDTWQGQGRVQVGGQQA